METFDAMSFCFFSCSYLFLSCFPSSVPLNSVLVAARTGYALLFVDLWPLVMNFFVLFTLSVAVHAYMDSEKDETTFNSCSRCVQM